MWKKKSQKYFFFLNRTVIALAQLFCILPIYGIYNRDQTKVRFKWFSARTILNLVLIFFIVFEIVLFFKLMHQMGIDFKTGELLTFTSFSLFEAVVFFKLARKWSAIIKFWYKKEKPFLNYPYEVDGWRLKTKIKVGVFTLLFGALSEFEVFYKIFFLNYYLNKKNYS